MIKFFLYLIFCILLMFLDFLFNLRGLLTLIFDVFVCVLVIVNSKKLKQNFKISSVTYLIFGALSLMLLAILKEIIVHYFYEYPINFYKNIDVFFVVSIVLKSFTEEVIFRKFWLQYFSEKYHLNISILITSLGFAFLHIFSKTNPIFAFLSSLVLCYIYFQNKSIISTYIIHLMINLFVIFIMPSFLVYYSHVESWNKIKTIVIVILLTICFLKFLLKKDNKS